MHAGSWLACLCVCVWFVFLRVSQAKEQIATLSEQVRTQREDAEQYANMRTILDSSKQVWQRLLPVKKERARHLVAFCCCCNADV